MTSVRALALIFETRTKQPAKGFSHQIFFLTEQEKKGIFFLKISENDPIFFFDYCRNTMFYNRLSMLVMLGTLIAQ